MKEPRRALASMKRVVKDGGKVIVPAFCHGENLLSRVFSAFMTFSGFQAVGRWSIKGV